MSRIALARSWADRFTAMESLIAQRIADAQMSSGVSVVWRELVATGGRVTLGSLASELDCSHRMLIARFRTCVGCPPKAIARLLRFNRVMRSLDRSSRARANEAVGKPHIEPAQADDRRVGERVALVP